MSEYHEDWIYADGWNAGREAGYESRDEEVRDLEDKIEKLTAALRLIAGVDSTSREKGIAIAALRDDK